jgi:hypothetical protein
VAKAKERNSHFFLNFLFNHFEERLNAPRLIGLLTKLALFYNSSRMEHIISHSDEKLVAINRPVHNGELALGDGISNKNGCGTTKVRRERFNSQSRYTATTMDIL